MFSDKPPALSTSKIIKFDHAPISKKPKIVSKPSPSMKNAITHSIPPPPLSPTAGTLILMPNLTQSMQAWALLNHYMLYSSIHLVQSF